MKHLLTLLEHLPETCPACGAKASGMSGRDDNLGWAKIFDMSPMPHVARDYECGATIAADKIRDDDAPLVCVKDGCKAAVRRALPSRTKLKTPLT